MPRSRTASVGGAANAAAPAKSGLRELIEQLLVAVVLALFARTFVLQTFKIPTGSMEDSLLVGDQLIVNKMVLSDPAAMLRGVLPVDSIARGDVLVFKYPVDPERDFIKRVIALPGETIEVRNKKVYVDGKALDEPYTRFLFPPDPEGAPKRKDPRWNFGPYTVAPGRYFMMGDNRDNSEDSRFWGAMPKDHVKGRALFIHWSLTSQEGPRWERLFRQIH